MPTKQDIELALRASDTTTKKTFDAAKQAVDGLVKSVRDSVGALESGDVSAGKLAGTLDKLKSVGTSLANQQGLIEQYKLVSERLADAQDKAQKLREDANRLAAAQAAQATVTRAQASELSKLERAAASAEKSVNGLQRQSETYGAKLTAAGIGTENLAAATAKIGVEANRVGTAIRAVSTALENFDAIQEGVARNAEAGAQAQAEATRKKNAALLSEQAFIADATAGLRELAAAEKLVAAGDEEARIRAAGNAAERFEAQAKRAAAAERDRAKAEQEANSQQQALGQFRQIAEDALAADRNLTAFASAEGRAAASTVTLKQGLTELLQPSEQAYKTLDGLQAKVVEIGETIGEAEKPFANYQQQLYDLGKAQSSILNQAGLIDEFRQQQGAVDAARASYAKAADELRDYATQMKAADAPSADLVRELRLQELALAGAGKAVGVEEARLAELSASLRAAKIDTNDLIGAENRLKETAGSVAAAQARLAKASEGNKGGAFAFLGLQPYALQNLGYQINDVVTQLASGTHVSQVFAQQGGQILQIFPGIFSAIAGLLPLIAVAGVAFGGLFLAIHHAFEQRDLVRSFTAELVGLSDGSKYSAQQLTEVTDSLTRYGIKLADAKELTTQFVRDGLNPARLVEFGRAAKDLADVTGVKLAQAGSTVADSFSKGYDSVLKLNESYHFLTPALNDTIRGLFEQGKAVEARTLAFNAFRDSVKASADVQKGPGVEAFRALGNAIKDFFNFSIVNDPAYQGLIKLLDLADKAAAGFNRAHDAASRLGSVQLANTAQPDRELLAKTAILEGGNTRDGVADVASSIANRAAARKQSINQVISAQHQYEGVDDKFGNLDNTKLGKVDTSSKQYRDALAVVDRVLAGLDTVAGATNFYGKAAQDKLRAQDGRNAKAGQGNLAFARPELLAKDTTAQGGNVFFRDAPNQRTRAAGGAGPNDNAPITNPQNSQAEIGLRNLLKDYQDQFDQQTKQDYAARVEQARQKAAADVASKGGDPTKGTGLAVVQQAIATQERLNDLDRRQLSTEVGSAIAGLQKSVQDAQTQSLAGINKAIHDQVDVIRQRVDNAKNQGLPNIQIAGVTTTLDQANKLLDALENTQKVTAATTFYEKQLGDLTKERGEAVAKINADLTNGLIQPKDAIAAIAKVTADFQPRFAKLASDAHALRDGLKDAKPDPALLALLTQVDAAGPAALADSAKQQLTAAENAVNGIVTARDEALAAIRDKISDPNTTGDDVIAAYQQAIALQGTYNARILEGARFALQVAENLKAAGQNTPQNEAAIGKFQGVIAQASKPSATNGTSVGIGNADTALIEGNINKLIAERNERVTTLNTLEEQGALLDKDRRAQTQAIFAESAPAIQAEIASEQKLLDLRLAQHNIKPADYAAETAKLKLLGTQANYVDENFTKLRSAIIDSLANGGVQAIDSGAEALGNFVAGTESAKDAITDVGRAAVNFFAQFLRDIANALLQMEALQAIKNLPFLNGLTSSILDTTGLGASASALAGAGGSLVAGGASLSAAAGPLALTAAALEAAAASVLSAATAQTTAASAQTVADTAAILIHGGGIVGQAGGQSRQGVSALAFIGAPRYHTGNPGVGLKSDEQAAVLQKGEEVLSKDDPRNRNNSRGKKGGGDAGGIAFRHVLIQDPADIPAAMAGAQGEQVTLTHIKQNAATIRQLLR